MAKLGKTTDTLPTAEFEREIGGVVAGVDEVGRGCLAGPVCAAAVILPAALLANRLKMRDSKQMPAKRRNEVADILAARAGISLGWASAQEIDCLNIRQATLLAMRRAIYGLKTPPRHCLIDGRDAPPVHMPTTCLIKGDQRSVSIAAASIVAKSARDAFMQQMDLHYPGYGWANNAGYGVRVHRETLRLVGPTPLHRYSFKPVRQAHVNASFSPESHI